MFTELLQGIQGLDTALNLLPVLRHAAGGTLQGQALFLDQQVDLLEGVDFLDRIDPVALDIAAGLEEFLECGRSETDQGWGLPQYFGNLADRIVELLHINI